MEMCDTDSAASPPRFSDPPNLDLPQLVMIPEEVCLFFFCFLRVCASVFQCFSPQVDIAFPAPCSLDVRDLGLSPFNTFSPCRRWPQITPPSLPLPPSTFFLSFHPPTASVLAVKLCGCLPPDNFYFDCSCAPVPGVAGLFDYKCTAEACC